MSRLTSEPFRRKLDDSSENYKVRRKGREEWETLAQNAINKLGRLEDIEEELGCPLEVVFKAMKQGYIYVYDNHYNFDDYTKTKAKITFNNDKFYIGFARNTRRLQDYQISWWLKREKDETCDGTN